MFGDVFERHVIHDDVAVEVIQQGLASLRAGFDQDIVRENVDAAVGLDTPLRAQEKRLGSMTGLDRLDGIRGQRVQQAQAVFAGGADARPCADVEQSRAVAQGLVTVGHELEVRREKPLGGRLLLYRR
ncbi:MAG: hypothetical protein R2748_08775 [Bryobacterales bacterium]